MKQRHRIDPPIKLLRCPFDGGPAILELEIDRQFVEDKHEIGSGAKGPHADAFAFDDEETARVNKEACELWNKAPRDPAIDASWPSEAIYPTRRRSTAMKLPETDSVAICRLSRDTQHAIAEALFDSGFDMGKSWYDFDLCCGIFFRLKYSQDDPKLFPNGKWATLQRLEQLIEQAVRKPEVKG